MVNDGEDGVLPFVHREPRNEVHCYLLEGEGLFVSCYAEQGNLFPVSYDFVLLADCTSFDVVGDPLVHPWPSWSLSCSSYRFVSSWVSRSGVVMSENHGHFLSLLGKWCSFQVRPIYEF